MTDASGTVVWAADYKPFGEATITVSTITNNLRFPGQYYDAETGLHYNYFRDHNPIIGKYIEPDRINLTSLHLPLPLFKTKINYAGKKDKILKKILINYSLYHPQTQNPYPYVENNPVNRTDPNGDYSIVAVVVVGAGIAATVWYQIYRASHPPNMPNPSPQEPVIQRPPGQEPAICHVVHHPRPEAPELPDLDDPEPAEGPELPMR